MNTHVPSSCHSLPFKWSNVCHRSRVILLLSLLAASALAKPPSAELPTASSPIAITSDDRFVWVVNPDNDSVSVIEVGGDANRKIAEIPVGEEPRSVAITPDDRRVFVSNTRSGTVTVIDAARLSVLMHTRVGTEPGGLAVTPDGKRVFVANFSSGDVSVLNAHSGEFMKNIAGVGPKPRAVAIVGNKVYVTQFQAQLRNDGRPVTQLEGRDDGKEARVTIISAQNFKVLGTVVLNKLDDTGFKSNGSTLDRVPLRLNPEVFDTVTGAFPNQLDSIVIKGNRAYLPNVAASPNGPFRFNVNVQSFLSVFDVTTDQDSGQTINMNFGVQFENVGQRLFNTTPIAIGFKQSASEGFAVLAGVDRLLRVELDANGRPTINAPTALLPANTPSSIVRIQVGQNPQGIVLNSSDSRAYVMNYISRDVSVVDIASGSTYQELARIASASLPAPGTLDAIIHRGNELFNTSIGPAGTGSDALMKNATPPAGRMSDFGWGNCYNCHPRGLADGVTWMFPDGPRQTISMESTGEHPQPAGSLLNSNGAPMLPAFKQRVLNWSAVRDEIQDFERNIRLVSGGEGLIRGVPITDVPDLVPKANTGRDADLDALAAYVAMGIKAPISPLRGQDVSAGRALFEAANCQQCHGGPNWTRSQVSFTPPAIGEPITANQLTRFLTNVNTFFTNLFTDGVSNEIKPNQTTNLTANGILGFNVPSLLSVFAGAPYLHSGAAPTLEDVLENMTHRSAGTGVDTLANPADRKSLVEFLKSIDSETPPFP